MVASAREKCCSHCTAPRGCMCGIALCYSTRLRWKPPRLSLSSFSTVHFLLPWAWLSCRECKTTGTGAQSLGQRACPTSPPSWHLQCLTRSRGCFASRSRPTKTTTIVVGRPVCLSVCLSGCLSVYLSICLSVYLSIVMTSSTSCGLYHAHAPTTN